MEHYPVKNVDGGIRIEGFPDAVKLLKLDDPKAQRISDLLLHRSDLEFAASCLEAINTTPADLHTVREALWRCAIIHFAKCFGNSAARFRLSREKVYIGERLAALQAFEYFKHLRNKHIVHDENSYAQSISGAVLNRGDKPYKIEKILCFAAHGNTLEQGNYNNLKLLIDKALAWVVNEFDTCCEVVSKELEAIPYEELLARPDVQYHVPSVEEISGNRKEKP
ncbi:MAG: hypothetical protein N0E59_10720 [Candidatus Thiodiazotropha taylori]|nr:hypothetical protein [Candidatus Thiodiazotropha taylori]MCG8096749.1 hypothetical protein [Candidatus Thiodiazotropha endolucinida]MCG8105543.1 hypothetical protein [Candidatus Thiodiazotropha taylori]MCG8111222.1 hypothetical protein [Candidatus Thiodiazotropha taylori]MCW4277879.1 hypothetical protein [Candidatus Thiodiazotropha taylori]